MAEGKPGGEVRAPVWVSALVAILVVGVTSAILLPPFIVEYLRVSQMASKAPASGDAEDGSAGPSDFYIVGGMDMPESAEIASMPISLRVPRRYGFDAAFALGVVGSLPVSPERLDEQQVKSALGLSIDPGVDYFLLFLAAPRFNEYSRGGFPDAVTVLDSVKPQEVRGILERVKGRFILFAEPAQVANELSRLRKEAPMLESSP